MKPTRNMQPAIPFNRPLVLGSEWKAAQSALTGSCISGESALVNDCEVRIGRIMSNGPELPGVRMTPSCSHALEVSMLLLGIGPGDEVIMPSFNFVSAANAVALRGARPVYGDIDPQTLNLVPDEVERLVSERTRAVVIVHYGGRPCSPDRMREITDLKGITLIEDAAHALGAACGGRKLGTWGDLATFSFHETKNLTCGEGGALAINRGDWLERLDILLNRGTNRGSFLRGEVPYYSWVDLGSTYRMSSLLAAMLQVQLSKLDQVNERRQSICNLYAEGLSDLKQRGLLSYPDEVSSTGHIFFVLLECAPVRQQLQNFLQERGIEAVFHYQPLHTSPFGQQHRDRPEPLPVTESVAPRLLRLPLYYSLRDSEILQVIEAVAAFFVRK